MFIVYLMTKSNKIEKKNFCVISPLKLNILGIYWAQIWLYLFVFQFFKEVLMHDL